jgi:hypothetical protein
MPRTINEGIRTREKVFASSAGFFAALLMNLPA